MEEFQEILQLIQNSYFFKVLKITGWVLFFVTWLGAISFVIKDAKKRYEKSKWQYSVILLPLLGHLIGFFIYLFIRPAHTKTERIYEGELLDFKDELFICPNCGYEIKEDFIFCPKCGEELFTKCNNCGRTVRRGWQYCPYCRQRLKS
jgi:RNA polymerase subunit RPABC4/transcription elongation factor Spt4